MLKTLRRMIPQLSLAYHLGEGRVLKTKLARGLFLALAYHLGEGRVLKTVLSTTT